MDEKNEALEQLKDRRLPDPDHQPESFRDFHDEMRKYRRRVFVRKEQKGTVKRQQPKVKGKALRKAMKRNKVAILKEGGHERGDNRKVIWRAAPAEAEAES